MPDFGYYLRRVRELPFREVVKRAAALIKTRTTAKAGYLPARFLGTRLSDVDFLKKGLRPDLVLQKMPDVVSQFRERSGPAFFVSAPHRAEIVQLIAEQFQAGKDGKLAEANKVCAHVFDLLGSGDVALGPKIDWHCDFKTGCRWNPKTYYRDIAIPYGEGDIKVPWELSRFSHAVTLGQAFWLTKDERYTREFMAQVDDWIDSNKPKFGPNWACTMDVAIRACNWIAGYYFFRGSSALDDAFLLKFLKSLYQHGKHIRDNLEYSETLTSNHYLSNITGLIYLGVMFPEFREAAEWRVFGIRELKKEMQKQVYQDGCDFEASTCYHRLVLELFFFPTLLAVVNDPGFRGDDHAGICRDIFGEEYTERLKKMFRAVLYLLKPNGMMPQIGDNDSGRLHIFAGREVLDMRYLLSFGAIFFQEPQFKVREFGFCEDALWVFGDAGYRTWADLEGISVADIKSRAFPDAGWHVMRNRGDYLLISCGPNGQDGNGGHAHNDKLSVELSIEGSDIFVDPGTYVYTSDPATRNLFRSTGYHTTVKVDDLEQNRYHASPRGLFSMENGSHAHVVSWASNDEHDLFSGGHAGFGGKGYHHYRSIDFMKTEGTVRIRDTVRGDAPRAVACFRLKPGVSVVRQGDGGYRMNNVVITFSGHDRIETADAWYSPEYGRKEKSRCIEVFFGNALETTVAKVKA